MGRSLTESWRERDIILRWNSIERHEDDGVLFLRAGGAVQMGLRRHPVEAAGEDDQLYKNISNVFSAILSRSNE